MDKRKETCKNLNLCTMWCNLVNVIQTVSWNETERRDVPTSLSKAKRAIVKRMDVKIFRIMYFCLSYCLCVLSVCFHCKCHTLAVSSTAHSQIANPSSSILFLSHYLMFHRIEKIYTNTEKAIQNIFSYTQPIKL